MRSHTMTQPIRVTIWNEFRHEQESDEVRAIYPDGIHHAIHSFLAPHQDLLVRTATLGDPEHGLDQETVDQTDVFLWWGHIAHHEVDDAVVRRVHARVLDGAGLIALHSAHFSKIFQSLMGTTCSLQWREAAERERLWNLEPTHPITEGIGECIELPQAEMYGERFDIPSPDKLIFLSWFQGGEVFRSGCTWTRGAGKVFYFRPGHETYPIYYNDDVQRVILNAVRWARPRGLVNAAACVNVENPRESLA